MPVPTAPLNVQAGGPRLIDGNDVNAIVNFLNAPTQIIGAVDSGATQTLTVAQVAPAAIDTAYHTSTGGATPTLTMPTAAAIIAAMPFWAIGASYVLRVINGNSGTATMAAGAGITLTGTATLATNTWREYVMTYTAVGAISMVNVGAGTI